MTTYTQGAHIPFRPLIASSFILTTSSIGDDIITHVLDCWL